MSDISTQLSCEQCRRQVSEILICPERPLGKCPFVKQRSSRKHEILLIGGMIALFVFSEWKNGWWVLVCLTTIGIWAIFLVEVQLYNAKLHIRLQYTTIAHIKISHKWTSRGKLLPIHLEPSQPLDYPPSISAFAALPTEISYICVTESQVGTIFRAAFIDLLVKKCVEVYIFQATILKRRCAPRIVDDYIIVATQNTDRAKGAGALEREILRALADWPNQSESKEWTHGPPIYDLIYATYKNLSASATKPLIRFLADDAFVHGLGRGEKVFLLRWYFEWNNPAYTSRLRQEHKVTQVLSRQLVQTYSEFSRTLDKEIVRAFNSVNDANSGGGGGG